MRVRKVSEAIQRGEQGLHFGGQIGRLSARVSARWCQRRDNLKKAVKRGGKRECPAIGRYIDKLEYRVQEVVRPNFAAIVDKDDRFTARQMFLKIEKKLSIF